VGAMNTIAVTLLHQSVSTHPPMPKIPNPSKVLWSNPLEMNRIKQSQITSFLQALVETAMLKYYVYPKSSREEVPQSLCPWHPVTPISIFHRQCVPRDYGKYLPKRDCLYSHLDGCPACLFIGRFLLFAYEWLY
jgi:hypothetical protein